ncbi:hypothetical protein MIR68_007662 [Amoeboaphelidium protococcarum]|nr:hypothetical protein MIR68_007662 [Amoeboaphelidium protococcarum]
MERLEIPMMNDFHIHLRDGEMMEMVVPCVRQGGVQTCTVMPNLVPPITTTEMAVEYRDKLERLDDKTLFLMTLYLNEKLTRGEIEKASRHGVVGVKMYPQGVTTNSSAGVVSDQILDTFDEVFSAMQDYGLILMLHGEVGSCFATNTCIMNAEEKFLPTFKSLAKKYPRLKIVLEHVTTKAAVDAVKEVRSGGNLNVGATITAHHLLLTVDDIVYVHKYCKPVAKYPLDVMALRDAALNNPAFFLGSDSAPHPVDKKLEGGCAGIFTSKYLAQYLAYTFSDIMNVPTSDLQRVMTEFTHSRGLSIYGEQVEKNYQLQFGLQSIPEPSKLVLIKGDCQVSSFVKTVGESIKVVPFMANQNLGWTIESS